MSMSMNIGMSFTANKPA